MWFGGGSSAFALNGGAEGADGRGGCAPHQKNFCIFSFEMVHFDAFLEDV